MSATGNKIGVEELHRLFPDGLPLVAMKLLFPEKSTALTTMEVRRVLRAIAALEDGE